MSNETSDTSAVIDETTQQTSSNVQNDVKPNIEQSKPKQEPNPVKKEENDSKPDPKSDPNMVMYGGHYPIHKDVYEEIKRNSMGEQRRRDEESGLIITEDIKQSLENYQQIMDTLGSVISPGESITKEKVELVLDKERKKAVDSMVGHNKKLEKQLEETKQYSINLKESILKERKLEVLTKAALKSGVSPESVDDFVNIISQNEFIRIDEKDMKTPYILDQEGVIKRDSDGNPETIANFVKGELEKRPYFMEVADKSGVGDIRGRGQASQQAEGLLGTMLNNSQKNSIIKKETVGSFVGVRKKNP